MDNRPVAVSFTKTGLVVELAGGRSIVTPLAWYPASRGRAKPSAAMSNTARSASTGLT